MFAQKLKPFLSILLLVSLLALPLSAAQANTGPLPDLEQFMDNLMRQKVVEQHIPNAAIAIVSGDEVLFLQGYGSADLDENLPVDPQSTLFRVGSVSKLFTWTAVMQLVEAGKLDLNADVNDYLDFQIPSRLASGDSEAMPITLAHLLTHTGGFEDHSDEVFRLAADELLPLGEYVRTRLPARVFPPGEVSAYSNYGASLAGYIVERVSGQPFAEYIEQHIFTPLGMTHSTFRQPVPGELAAHLARPYRFVNGVYLPGGFEYMQMPEGGLSSTVADMARFMLAHLRNESSSGEHILQPATLDRMHTRQPVVYPALGGMTLGFMEGVFNGQRVLFHGGSTMVFDSGLYMLPEENIGIFVTYSGANHLVHTELFQQFMDRYYPAPAASVPQPAEGAAERARAYTGEYHQNRRSFTTDEKFLSLQLGVMQVAADDNGDLQITHVGETNRFVEVDPGVYRNLREGRTQDYFGPFRTVVFKTDPYGHPLLITDGPMTYSRAPGYATSTFTFLSLGLILLLALGSLIAWGLGFVVSRLKRKSPAISRLDSPASVVARWAAIAFALLTLVFLVGVLAGGGSPHPVYLLPASAFGVPSAWDPLLIGVAWGLIIIGASMAAFTVLSWVRRYWTLPGRLHYTVLSAAALLFIWIINYWNVI